MITKDGFQLDLKTYECYIDSLLAGEEYERAFLIFDSLKSKNMYPNLESFIGIIRKAISINEPGIALKYLNELEQNQFVYVPDSLYNDVLRSSTYEYYVSDVIYSSVYEFFLFENYSNKYFRLMVFYIVGINLNIVD